jgi:hypothetical protein
MGRPEEARRSLAWALQVSPASLPLPKLDEAATRQTAGSDLFRYPRSLLVSWLSNLGMQTTGYILWAPTLFVMLLGVSPAQASYLFIFVSLAGFVGRFVFSGLSELIGCGSRRADKRDRGFESVFLEQPVCLSGEPRGRGRKAPHFGSGLRVAGDVRRDVQAANRDAFALFL